MQKTFALTATLWLALFSSAFADGSSATATLASAMTRPTQIVAGGAVWTCDGSACRGPASADRTLSVSACQSLVRQAGPVTTYAVDRHALSAGDLARCVGGKLPA